MSAIRYVSVNVFHTLIQRPRRQSFKFYKTTTMLNIYTYIFCSSVHLANIFFYESTFSKVCSSVCVCVCAVSHIGEYIFALDLF